MQYLLIGSMVLYVLALYRRVFLLAGLAAESIYLLWRGLTLGRLPLVGLHDTLIFFCALTVGFSLVISATTKQHRSFLIAIALLAIVFTGGGMLSNRVDSPLPAVLQTYWFELHVVLSFVSYGLFAVSAVVSFTAEAHSRARLQYLTAYVGYIFFSLSMIFGGIWAYFAWGTYWLWTPKEIWTTLLWLVYTLFLHVRFMGKEYEGFALWLGRIGFLVVLFTYIGVGLFMKSSHSF